jgi:hypothetical protein
MLKRQKKAPQWGLYAIFPKFGQKYRSNNIDFKSQNIKKCGILTRFLA